MPSRQIDRVVMKVTCGTGEAGGCEGTGAPELGLALRCEDDTVVVDPDTISPCRTIPVAIHWWARRVQPACADRCDGISRRRTPRERAREWSRYLRAVVANTAMMRPARECVEVAGEC